MNEIVQWLAEPLQFGFMQRALLVSLAAGLVCAVLSCWITLIGWSLLGDAVSHAVLPGVVLAYVLALPFSLGAFLFGSLAVGLIAGVRSTTKLKGDAAIGVVFTGLFALGLVLVSRIPSQVDLNHILFGNVLGVTDSDILQVLVIAAIVLAVALAKRRDLTLYAFDPTHAHAIGLNPRRIGALLLTMLALTVVVALQAVGVILVTAMLITPGATAFLLTKRFPRMLAVAAALSVFSSVLGTYLSFHLDTSTGGMIVVCQTAVFALVYLGAPEQGLIARTVRRRGRTGSPVRA
ncbi:manganese transport system permease protein [Saccharopolyspora antimicrobica]|uniref:Manganese transport system permease protein n=1 Tax=Saccharopolyspora antimicrobica TaxID=455193 RepID=A0A1I4T1X7_9PSEU|nr:metal ABC transporter permease [Saccharopolyspora antimicrobica]RKT85911.1 manganese transport system permease protein [Saccharopolyspora antimicrobica]SFM70593.1 manganese transport system permease protein [Saccharopolyspora antimicrobica]